MSVSLLCDFQWRVELYFDSTNGLDLDLATARDDVAHHIFGVLELLLVLHVVPVREAVESLLGEEG